MHPRNRKALFLLENGFCEREYTALRRVLDDLDVPSRIASGSTDIISAWNKMENTNKSHWGQKYAPDYKIGELVSSQFDILVVTGGRRSIEKLKLDRDVKSLISGFLVSGKPVIVFNLGHDVLMFYDLLLGYNSAYSAEKRNEDYQAFDKQMIIKSRNLISLSGYDHDPEILRAHILAILDGDLCNFDPEPVSVDSHKAA